MLFLILVRESARELSVKLDSRLWGNDDDVDDDSTVEMERKHTTRYLSDYQN